VNASDPWWHRPTPVLGGGLVLALLCFWPSWVSFAAVWSTDGFSHGWAIAGLTCWLVWRHRRRLTPSQGEPDAALLLALAALSMLWLAAAVAHVRVMELTLVTSVILVWALAMVGRVGAKAVASIGATFLLAVPVWPVLIAVLRPLTVAGSGAFLWLIRIPAEIDGDVITIASGSFLVEDGCAGLRYLLASLTLAVFYAHLLLRAWPLRFAAVGLAAVIAIVGNWIRVTVLVIIGHVSQMRSVFIEDHLWMGWVVFCLGMIPFFLIAERMRVRGERAGGAVLDERAAPGPEGGERVGGPPAGLLRRALAATGVAVLGPLVYLVVGALPQPAPSLLELDSLSGGGRWMPVHGGGAVRSFGWEPAFRGADEHATLAFRLSGGDDTVYADRLAYLDQRQGAELIGYGNAIAQDSLLVRDAVAVVPHAGRTARWIRQAIVRTPETPILVWYWYRIGGVETFSERRAKLLEPVAFLRRRPAAEVVALSAPCSAESCQEAARTLASFLGGP
jgi:EpsI family protein